MSRVNKSKLAVVRRCMSCEEGVRAKSEAEIRKLLTRLPGWNYEDGEIVKTFSFENYEETVTFVNAIVWIARRENHHPTIEFGYRTCCVKYSTHAIRGISDIDFLCAARINLLLAS